MMHMQTIADLFDNQPGVPVTLLHHLIKQFLEDGVTFGGTATEVNEAIRHDVMLLRRFKEHAENYLGQLGIKEYTMEEEGPVVVLNDNERFLLYRGEMKIQGEVGDAISIRHGKPKKGGDMSATNTTNLFGGG